MMKNPVAYVVVLSSPVHHVVIAPVYFAFFARRIGLRQRLTKFGIAVFWTINRFWKF